MDIKLRELRGEGGDDDDSVVLGGEARQLTRPGRHFPQGAHTHYPAPSTSLAPGNTLAQHSMLCVEKATLAHTRCRRLQKRLVVVHISCRSVWCTIGHKCLHIAHSPHRLKYKLIEKEIMSTLNYIPPRNAIEQHLEICTMIYTIMMGKEKLQFWVVKTH